MRKSILFSFTLMIVFAWCNLIAQDYPTSAGPIPSDLKGETSIKTYDPTPTDNTVGFAFSTSNNQFESLPLPGGTPLTLIGPFTYADFAGGGCFGGDGQFYVSTVGNTTGQAEIWIQDINNGTATLVGQTGTGADGFNGIAYDWTDGTYYGATGSSLYTFDNSTGTATLVGPFNNTGGLAIDIAIDCNGIMYMHDLGLDNIYTVDKSTGNATLVGPTGFDANFGQGMGYDHDAGTLYLFAFNNTTFTAQLMTVDVNTGAATMVFDYGLDQHAPFDGQAGCGAPCPVGQATDPTPANGATDIPLTGNTAMWTNGSGATEIEVFFNGTSVYTGAPITSLSLAGVEPLDYSTTYTWRVDGSDGTCTTFGQTWSFTTIPDPNLANLFCDDFTAGLNNWTITNDGGTCVWDIFQATEYTMPPTAVGNVMAADADACGSGTTLLSTATLANPIDATLYQTVWVEFDNDWQAIDADDFAILEVSTDGGTTWQEVFTWGETDIRNTHEVWDLTSMVAQSNFTMRFVSIQPGWDWWWAVDNVCVYGTDPVPVELASFTASASAGVVELNWITATETNNQGFEVQRSNGSDYETIAFVDGNGTTTATQAYSYTDRSVEVGVYTYRLKQVDFDGTFEYSSVIEVDVPAPAEFGLEQNYPNPFNPSTKISFQLKVDAQVSLKVFDVLGQEVATIVNSNLVAGAHSVNFDASALNSGVYLYRIEATGNDGSNFIDVKKMILTK
jgi:hypothetical protein